MSRRSFRSDSTDGGKLPPRTGIFKSLLSKKETALPSDSGVLANSSPSNVSRTGSANGIPRIGSFGSSPASAGSGADKSVRELAAGSDSNRSLFSRSSSSSPATQRSSLLANVPGQPSPRGGGGGGARSNHHRQPPSFRPARSSSTNGLHGSSSSNRTNAARSVSFQNKPLEDLDELSEMLPHAEGVEGEEGEEGPNNVDTWETIEPPEEFVCPLSLEIMYDPVIVSSGQTYERAFIARWITEGHTTCPKTRQPLDALAIFPNQVLKVMIVDWCKQNGVPLPTPRDPSGALALGSGDQATIPQPLRRSRQAAENAARANAVALESERRQRALLERMAEERGGRRGEGGEAPISLPRRQSLRRGGSHAWARNLSHGSNASADGSIGGEGGGFSGSARVSDTGALMLTSPSSRGPGDASFTEEHQLAGWPGQLAMQASIFKRLMGEAASISSLQEGLEGGAPGEASGGTLQQRGSEAAGHSGRSLGRSATGVDRGAGTAGQFSAAFSVDGSVDEQSVGTSAAELQMVDVEELVQSVKSGAPEDQAAGAALLRVMTRHGFKHAKKVVTAGAVAPLVDLLRAQDEPTVEHATTTLLNLALDERLKSTIGYELDIIPNMVHVLNTGMPQARANAAAALYCIAGLDGMRERIRDAGAIPALVVLLESGSASGKKDAANTIVSLLMSKENRAPIAKSGVVAVLCGLLHGGMEALEEQTAAIFAALVRDPEGRTVLFEEGAIPALAELVEGGTTSRCREYSVNALLGLAVNSKACLAAIDEEGISASIDVLTRTGSTKTQAKATALLELLRQFDASETPG